MPVLLMVLFGLAVVVGAAAAVFILRQRANQRLTVPLAAPAVTEISTAPPPESLCLFRWPDCWLVVKSRSPLAVQAALGLSNPRRCSWLEGVADDHRLFITPSVNGWVLVLGAGLPDPGEDVDACFRFILGLSRKLGQVQFFCASRVLHHHAWVRARAGQVLRAYAWAGRTVWQQGKPTREERELAFKCYDYFEPAAAAEQFGSSETLALNVEKVPLLAARWSLDPAGIARRFIEAGPGIAGELARRY